MSAIDIKIACEVCMKLRKFLLKDAPYMLEWMHDKNVLSGLQAEKFINKNIQDCEEFIKTHTSDINNLHMAIVDENDVYMGTVSLKHITENDAEFAIAIRTCAMGKGYAGMAMKEIIRIGHEELGIKYIYWGVRKDNLRAIRFYDKNLYRQSDISVEWTSLKKGIYDKTGIDCRFWYLSVK